MVLYNIVKQCALLFNNLNIEFSGALMLLLIFQAICLPQEAAHDQHLPSKISFERLDYPELKEKSVYCLLQDRRGFIWIGSGSGLYKYDGYGFIVYKNDVHDTTSISDDYILCITEDQSGNIWAGTLIGGLNRFNSATGTFTRFVHDPQNPQSLSNNQVQTIYADGAGTLWIGTSGGLNQFDKKSQAFVRLDPGGAANSNKHYIKSIFEDRFGTLWVGTAGGGLFRRNAGSSEFFHYTHDPANPHSICDNNVISIMQDSSGTLWFGTWGGLNRYDYRTNRFERFVHDPHDPHSINHNVVRSLLQDRSGRFWIGTEGGLSLLDHTGGTFIRIVHNPEDDHSLRSNFVTALLEDRAGALWVGTGNPWRRATGGGFGVNYLDLARDQFQELIPEEESHHYHGEFSVHTLLEDRDGILWVGSAWRGLCSYNRHTGQFQQYIHDPKDSQSLSGNFVMALHEDRSGTLWVGTADNGLNRLDRNTGKFRRFRHNPADPRSIGHNRVVSILEDRQGALWVVTFGGGLARLDDPAGKFTRFEHHSDDVATFSSNFGAVAFEDRSGTLWFCTWGGGLNRFDPVSGRFTHFVHDERDRHSLSNNFIWDIHEDAAGNLWLATSGGLNRFDPISGRFFHYTTNEGLPGNVVHAILGDDRGRLWLGTTEGLSCFDPVSERFKNYGVADGLQNTAFSFGAPTRSASGTMYFGGRNGIDFFHPDQIQDNAYVPPVVLTALKRYISEEDSDRIVVDNNIADKEILELTHDNRAFSLEFSALNYRSSDKNQYAYQLQGARDNWIHLGTQRSITFTNLAVGRYIFRVKGSNNDGIWNEIDTALEIVVHPPWWSTLWAYCIYGLLALGLLFSLRRYEMNRQDLKYRLRLEQLEGEKLLELDHLKSRFFAGISHEFRTPLTLISGPLQQIVNGELGGNLQDQYQRMLRNCRRLLRLINQLLDLSRLESGKMNLQASPHNVVALTRQLVMAFESLAHMQDIQLQFKGPDSKIPVYLERDHYEKIISNLLSNAIKFTPQGGNILVTISEAQTLLDEENPGGDRGRRARETRQISPVIEKFVKISVRDNGSGIAADLLPYIFDRFYQAGERVVKNTLGTGIGLALVKELVELHYGKIIVESAAGKGATFIIYLPLGKAHLDPLEIAENAGSADTADSLLPRQASFIDVELPSAAAVAEVSSETELLTLIVEDNADMRSYLRTILSPNYRVAEAKNGIMGLKKAVQLNPDLIISDVMMPEMDGIRLCEKIKSDPRSSHIPVILLTARASVESKIEGLKTGADDYLAKPFNAAELRVRVKNLIEQRRKLQERFRRDLIMQPAEVTATSMDEMFLEKVMAAIELHIDDPSFETDHLAREVGVSRRHLNRKLRALTGQSVRGFVRTMRLKRAARLLQQQAGTVTEIAYEVGFQSIAHFAKIFREQFGVSPSAYRTESQKEV